MFNDTFFILGWSNPLTPWHCVNTHLNASDQQTAKTSAFIEVLTLANDQLIKDIWLAGVLINSNNLP